MSDRIAHSRVAFAAEQMVYSKSVWLDDHSQGRTKRPDHELDQAREHIACLRQVHADYSIAAQREAERKGEAA